MKPEHFKISVIVLGVAFLCVFFLHAENGRYQIIQASIPAGTYYPTSPREAEVQRLNTVVRIDTRTGVVESYNDLSQSGDIPKSKVVTGWTELRDQREE
jgi:hypothetical protein